jgi:hypothetical protein
MQIAETTNNSQTRHFLLTQDGAVREFSAEQAALIAAGANRLPEYAQRRLRYLQVTLNSVQDAEIKVQTAGAAIEFDADGRLTEAAPPRDDEKISRFEHDACVQWALRTVAAPTPIVH